MTESIDSRDVLLNQLADEFAARQRAGERPRVEDYCQRHPHLADDIRSLFPAMIELEQAKAATPELLSAASKASPVSQLGDFRLLREVGRGGMGVVYEAEQVSLGRRVAIKLLLANIFRDPTKRLRFEREAKSAAKLHHSNIVPVHGIGEHDGTPYYVMQFIPGLGLDAVIEELRRLPAAGRTPEPTRPLTGGHTGHTALSVALARSLQGHVLDGVDSEESPTATFPGRSNSALAGSSVALSSSGVHLPGQSLASLDGSRSKKTTYWESVARIGVQVAGALSYAHKLGVLHRDIKPANLLLDLDAVVWVTDFGLAKAVDDSDDLTRTGDVLGTLRYMPPEAFEGKSDARSDIYALGLTLFELVALRPAYDERDRNKLVKEVTIGDTPRLRNFRRDAPRDLVTIIEKACDRTPARRYQSASALGEDLQLFLDGRPIIARRATDLERLWMWSRRRPAMAGMAAALFLCLIVGTVVSASFAFQAEAREKDATFSRDLAQRHASDAEKSRDEAEGARLAELAQRQRAEQEKKRADITLGDAYTSRGLLAGERDAAEAVLWFTAAAEQTAKAEDVQREADNRLRAGNYLRQAIIPVAAEKLSTGVSQLDFQPHGDLLLARTANEWIIWSWRDGRRLPWTEKVQGPAVAKFSPDGVNLALGFSSGETQIRNTTTGEVLQTIPQVGRIQALAYSPDAKSLAIAGQVVRIWDIERRAFINAGWIHPQPVTALAFNRKGDRLITVCVDKRARVFAVRSDPKQTEPIFEPVVHTVHSSPSLVEDDRVLVTVTSGSEIARWDMTTGKPASSPIRTESTQLRAVTASADGKWFATGGQNGPELFAAKGQQPAATLHHTNVVRDFAFSPDNSMLLSVSWDQSARLWSLPLGTPLGAPLKHMANVEVCAWSGDSRHFATAQNDGLIRVWRLPADNPLIAREADWGMLMRPRLSFDGQFVVPGVWHEAPIGANQNLMRLRVLKTDNGSAACADIPLPGALVDSCICSDSRGVAAIVQHGGKGLLAAWDLPSRRLRFEPLSLPSSPRAITARPGHHQLAVICDTGDLLVIDDQTGKRQMEPRHEHWSPHSGRSANVDYSPDGRCLISLCPAAPSSVKIFDADTGQPRFALAPTVVGANFQSFAISADSRRLATMALLKNHVQVWDLTTGRPISKPLSHPGDFWGLFSVCFSPDGRRLLTSHKDGQVRYWDWEAAKLACPPMAHDNDAMSAVITPGGGHALTAVRGRPEVQIWELITGRPVARPVRLSNRDSISTLPIAITPDGRRACVSFMPAGLAVVNLDALLRLSTIPTADLSLLAELITARRIELGDLSGLTTDQWIESWGRLHERNSGALRSLLNSPPP